jgi:beta-lactamase class A
MKYSNGRLAKTYKKQKIKSDFVIAIRIIVFLAFIGFASFSGFKFYKKAPQVETQAQETTPQPVVETPTQENSAPASANLEELKTNLNQYINTLGPTYGISLVSADGGINIGINSEQQFVAASTVKVPVAIYILNQIDKGIINPNSTITYTNTDYEGGTGIIQGDNTGTKYSVTKLLNLMISNSDNIALNMLFRNYGRNNFQNYLNTGGYTGIDLVNNKATASSMSSLLSDLYNNKLLKVESKNSLLSYMENSIVPERINNGVPTEVTVYHKIGTNPGAISDMAIINYQKKPYVLSVYSSGVTDEALANQQIKRISSMIYDFISKNY